MLVRTAGLRVHFEVWRHRICSQVSSFAGQRVNEQGGLKVVFVSSSLNGATGGREEPFAWKERRLGEGRVIVRCHTRGMSDVSQASGWGWEVGC